MADGYKAELNKLRKNTDSTAIGQKVYGHLMFLYLERLVHGKQITTKLMFRQSKYDTPDEAGGTIKTPSAFPLAPTLIQ